MFVVRCICILVVFFFQAEDGIRLLYVTGVQTCALPIFRSGAALARHLGGLQLEGGPQERDGRSEERRVGKECRSRWSPYHLKKKKYYHYLNDESGRNDFIYAVKYISLNHEGEWFLTVGGEFLVF